MALIDDIRADWIEARKARLTIESSLLGTLIGAIQSKEKTFSPSRTLNDAEVVAEVKKLLDGINETGKILAGIADRETEFLKTKQEAATLEKYMPRQLTAAEIETIATRQVNLGQNLGGVMAYLKTNYAGAYDGKLAAQIVKQATS